MCGIYGIVRRTHGCEERHDRELARMGQRLALRGPDGHGSLRTSSGRVLLGHRRLAIIDLSERAAQPMSTADGALAITFNGEIYNFRQLRKELELAGHAFRSDSDTEVLLHAYAQYGVDMLHKLRGMFAFALVDVTKGGVLLARDPLGIKPLYYADDGESVRFASQVRAVRAAGAVSAEPDLAGLAGFYLLGSVPEPHTIVRGVRALEAGHSLWISADTRTEPKPFFELARSYHFVTQSSGDSPARSVGAPGLHSALRDSVEHHLVADVHVGTFLSAGIDSGAVLALARECLGANAALTAVTLAFQELRGQANDEAPLAAMLARRYGATHKVRYVEQAELEADLPRFFDAMDQPTIDGLNTWFVSKAAHELGLKVALSGLGGDELLGGYPSFADIPRWHHAVRALGPVARLGSSLRPALSPLLAAAGISPKAAGLLELGRSFEGCYLLRRGLFMPWELPELMGREKARQGLAELALLPHIAARLEPDPGSDFARVATLESTLYMRNQLLRDTDWTSMAHSLEVRVPWVDHVLLSRVAPATVREGMRKRALAQAPTLPLPDEVVSRPKTGFTIPIDRWLEHSPLLDAWRAEPTLRRPHVHASRRYAYCVAQRYAQSSHSQEG